MKLLLEAIGEARIGMLPAGQSLRSPNNSPNAKPKYQSCESGRVDLFWQLSATKSAADFSKSLSFYIPLFHSDSYLKVLFSCR